MPGGHKLDGSRTAVAGVATFNARMPTMGKENKQKKAKTMYVKVSFFIRPTLPCCAAVVMALPSTVRTVDVTGAAWAELQLIREKQGALWGPLPSDNLNDYELYFLKKDKHSSSHHHGGGRGGEAAFNRTQSSVDPQSHTATVSGASPIYQLGEACPPNAVFNRMLTAHLESTGEGQGSGAGGGGGSISMSNTLRGAGGTTSAGPVPLITGELFDTAGGSTLNSFLKKKSNAGKESRGSAVGMVDAPQQHSTRDSDGTSSRRSKGGGLDGSSTSPDKTPVKLSDLVGGGGSSGRGDGHHNGNAVEVDAAGRPIVVAGLGAQGSPIEVSDFDYLPHVAFSVTQLFLSLERLVASEIATRRVVEKSQEENFAAVVAHEAEASLLQRRLEQHARNLHQQRVEFCDAEEKRRAVYEVRHEKELSDMDARFRQTFRDLEFGMLAQYNHLVSLREKYAQDLEEMRTRLSQRAKTTTSGASDTDVPA